MKSFFVRLFGLMLLASAVVGCDKEDNDQPAGARYAFCDERMIVEVTPQTDSFDLECLYLWPINDDSIYIPVPTISVDKNRSTTVEGKDFVLPQYGEDVTLTGHKFRIPIRVFAERITEEVKIVFVIDEIADRDLPSHTTVILRPAAV